MSAPTAGLAASQLAAKTNAKDYSNRQGYDEKFLGTKFAVPLPAMSKPTKDQIAEVRGARRAGVLDYTHFSVMLNKSRKMCFYAVVNIDGKQTKGLSKSHTWILDPRVDADLQAGPKVYEKNDLDRGHMVRRLDPVWGDAFQVGNSDTFHFPNACPQIHKFNDGIWGELEDYLLKNADVKDLKLTVFTGPIFGKDDRSYREIQIPSRYWKVAVMVSGSGSKMKLAAAGFMLSQDDLLISFESPLGPIPKKVTQVSIKEIEKLTGMKFGAATKADFLAKKVAAAGVSFDLEPPVMELHSLDQIVIPRR